MKCLSVPTEWNVGAANVAARRIPTAAGKVDFYSSYQGERAQIEEYSDLVWANTTLANTPKLFDTLDPVPTTTNELEAQRNQRRLRHIIMGSKIWNSLKPYVQIEYDVKNAEFKRGGEYDGSLLWDFIRRRVNPSTIVGASKLKEELENEKLATFDHDVTRYNTWFEDIRSNIIRDEGAGKYNEYLRNLFRAYMTCNNAEFVDAVKDERRKWMQGKLGQGYDYVDLMDLGRVTFNNLLENGDWKGKSEGENKVLTPGTQQKNFLALATEIFKAAKDQKPEGSTERRDGTNSEEGIRLRNGRELKAWRFRNPNGEKTKILKDSTVMEWCEKNCHPKPMWCGRQNCLSREEYAAKMGNSNKFDEGN